MGGRGRKRDEDRGKGGKGERPGYGYWRGAFSPAQRPWKEKPWAEAKEDRHPKALFPSYTAMPNGPPPEPSRSSAVLDVSVESETMVDDLQSLLNAARKKETRLAKLTAARERILAQWNEWNRQMREAFIKERTRFMQEDVRLEQEIARATEDQQQARLRVRGAFLGEQPAQRMPTFSMEVDSGEAAWEAARAAWSAEDGTSLTGVFQRCMAAPAPGHPRQLRPEFAELCRRPDLQPGPPQQAHAEEMSRPPASVEGGQGMPPPGLETPVPASMPDASMPQQLPAEHPRPSAPDALLRASPKHPGQRTGPRVPTSEAPPRPDIKAATKVHAQPSTGGTSLQDKLDAKRAHMAGQAMHPFGLPSAPIPIPEEPPPAASADISTAATAVIPDDLDELNGGGGPSTFSFIPGSSDTTLSFGAVSARPHTSTFPISSGDGSSFALKALCVSFAACSVCVADEHLRLGLRSVLSVALVVFLLWCVARSIGVHFRSLPMPRPIGVLAWFFGFASMPVFCEASLLGRTLPLAFTASRLHVGNATASPSFPAAGAPYSVGVEELVTYVGDPASHANPRLTDELQNMPWLVTNVSDLSTWTDNVAGRWLGVYVFTPHYQPIVTAVRCLHFHDAQHVLDAILDFAPGGPPEVAMTCVPTRPQCSPDAGSVLRFPTSVRRHPSGPHVAVLIDLRLAGGHRFACILPANFALHTLLAFAESMVPFSERGLLVYVGDAVAPHRQEVLRLRDGDVLLFALATEGLLVQYLQERFFMPPHHHSGQDAIMAVCCAYDVQPSESVTCAFRTADLEFRGNACSHVLGLFPLHLAHLRAPPSERRRDFAVLCDFRPVGYSPRAALVHVPILHLPSVAAMFGIRVPLGFRLRSLDGTQAGDEVEFTGHQVLTFVFEECPDPEARVEPYVTLDDLEDGSPPYHDVPVHFRASDRSRTSAAGRRGSQEVHRSRSRRGRSTVHSCMEIVGAKHGPVCQQFSHVEGLDGLIGKAFMWGRGFQQDALELGAHDSTPICHTGHACLFGPWFAPFARPWKLTCPSTLGLFQEYKLLTEPESHSLSARDLVEAARDFVEGEGRVWPFLPAHDPHALQRIAERAEDEAQTLGSEEAAEFTMCLLTPGYVMEEVVITLVPPAEVPEALQLTQDARDQVRRRLFPSLNVVDPQPSQGYGVLIALPGWATPETVICFSLLDVDERLFAASVPAVASRERLLAVAELSPPDLYDVYLEGSPTPMQDGEEAPMAPGICDFCMNRHELPGPYFHLPETLLTSMAWDDHPALPYGPDDGHMCYVGECSMRRVPLPDDMPLPDNSQVAAAFGIQLSSMLVQPASPVTRDVTMDGYYCYNVCAAYCPAAGEVGDRSCIILVDCRAMLQGWQLVFCQEGRLTRAQLIEDLSTFAPAGWDVHLEGLAGADDIHDVTPGQVIYASYVLIPHHWQPNPGPAPGLESAAELSIGGSSDPAGSSMESSMSSDGSSSQHPRSRSPYRSNANTASDAIAEAPFVLLGQEFAPELVVVPLPPNAEVTQVLEQVQARRDRICRERFGRIVPVHPQPSGAYALAVVQPPWSQELLVVFDCLRVTEAIYCWVASPAMTRAAILTVVGVPNTGEFEVYAPDSDLPMGPADVCQLRTGSCVSVIPSTCPLFVVTPLADMLLSGAGWDIEASLPCVPGHWLHVLSDTGPVSIQLAAGTPEALLPVVAEAIGLPIDQASIQFAAPPLTDFADEGRMAWNIAAATRSGALPVNPERCVYFIDMRAILCGLTWAVTQDGTVSVALIREQCGRAAAGGRRVEVTGGRPFHGRDDIVWVWPGAVLRIRVVAIPLAPHPGSFAPASRNEDDSHPDSG
ncbi:hypothetical protein AK812_SmicGene32531, partial [Symbiodinium microadriaticum]